MNPNPTEANNPFAVAAARQEASISIAQTRAAQEAQAQMVIAKRFPRNEEVAIERIRRSCPRRSLAEVACYAYPRGGTTVTGPSIRLAECLAQNWQNMEFGIVELEQRNGESTVLAFAWDLETNTRESKIFQVKHERRVGRGENFRIDKLEDARDIYEMVANQGARRLRSCILGVIPGDVVDIAVEQCERTLASGNTEPLLDRVRKMTAAFADYGISVVMLEKRLGHKLEATIEQELVNLRKIYTSIKDGMAKREDFFDLGADQMEPKKAKFSGKTKAEAMADEAAESKAGLAPEGATPTAPSSLPEQDGAGPASSPKGKGRKAKETQTQQGEGASSEPHKPASGGATPPPASAPATAGTDGPPAAPESAQTIQAQLAEFMTTAGVAFDDLRDALATHGLIQDASSVASYDELSVETCEKLSRNPKLMSSIVKTFGAKK